MERIIQSREFTAGDLEAVLGIASASPEAAAWNRQAYEEILANQGNSFCRVAEQGGCVVSFACFRMVGEEAELLNLAVLPSFRGQGIGAFLVKQTLLEVAEKGGKRIFLEVRDANLPALRLYERLGFEPVGRRPGYYTNPPADALVLQRWLTRQPGNARKDDRLLTLRQAPFDFPRLRSGQAAQGRLRAARIG